MPEVEKAEVEEEVAELLATVEEIRTRSYPNLEPGLVSAILTVQHQFAEDRPEARKRTEQLVGQWAAAKTKPETTA